MQNLNISKDLLLKEIPCKKNLKIRAKVFHANVVKIVIRSDEKIQK